MDSIDRTTTIKSLLAADFTQLSASNINSFESTDNIQQLQQSLQTNAPDHQWSIIRQEVLTQAEQLLDIELHPILVKSWHTHQAVKREIEQQQTTPNNHQASIVVLDAHEIRSTHSPTLSTKVGQSDTINLRFFIGVVLQLNNVSLKIQQGEIKTILAGVMSGCGFMQYQNATLIEKDFLRFKLAGDITYVIDKINNKMVGEIRGEKKNKVPKMISPPIATPQPQQARQKIPSTNTVDITTENRYEEKPSSTLQKNLIQFILGVLLAIVALFIFWQMIRGS